MVKHRVMITKAMGPVTFGDTINVESLEDLKAQLAKAGAISVSLAYRTFFDDDLRYEKHNVLIDAISEEDFIWIIEEIRDEVRRLCYT